MTETTPETPEQATARMFRESQAWLASLDPASPDMQAADRFREAADKQRGRRRLEIRVGPPGEPQPEHWLKRWFKRA